MSLEGAVVAIPVGFSPRKRRALRKAASDADITIRGFVSEPTAALFQKYDRVKQWSHVAVFDWGGGTLDISVLAIAEGIVHEVATIGTDAYHLGGNDIDLILAEWTHGEVLCETGKNGPPFSAMDPNSRDMMIANCENAKRQLATEDTADIILYDYGNFGDLIFELTADRLRRLLAPKIQKAIEILTYCVTTRARLSFDQLGCILMVGGSSKLRGLRDAMEEQDWSCEIIAPDEDSDWSVAHGAAMLSGNVGQYVSAQNLGILLSDHTVFPLLRDGDRLDHGKRVMTFGTVDDSPDARFTFMEAGKDDAGILTSSGGRNLGYLSVPVYGFPHELIKVESLVDEHLLLHVWAKSDRRDESTMQKWTYPELRFSYELPT